MLHRLIRPLRLIRLLPLLPLGLAVVLLSGCWPSSSSSSGARSAVPQVQQTGIVRAVTIGAVDVTELKLVQQMYGQMLQRAGYTVTYRTFPTRDAYLAQLESGAVDVVPEYAATMAEYLNQQVNGASARVVASSSVTHTVSALKKLAGERDLTVLEPAAAANQNGFAVASTFARERGISTLSQLAATRTPLVLAATPTCAQRPFCSPGLKRVYGLGVSKVLPLGFGTPATKQAVANGSANLALVGTTDGTLPSYGLTLLKDDKGLQLADNLVPVVNAAAAKDPILPAALDPIASVLTTSDLATLNTEVDGAGKSVESVAKAYLRSKDLS